MVTKVVTPAVTSRPSLVPARSRSKYLAAKLGRLSRAASVLGALFVIRPYQLESLSIEAQLRLCQPAVQAILHVCHPERSEGPASCWKSPSLALPSAKLQRLL